MAILEAGLKKVKESERSDAEEANSASDSDDEDEERPVVQREVSCHLLSNVFETYRLGETPQVFNISDCKLNCM